MPQYQRNKYIPTRAYYQPQASVKAKPKRRSFWVFLVAVLLVGYFVLKPSGSSVVKSVAEPAVKEPEKPAKKDMAQFAGQLDTIMASEPQLNIGVSVVDLVHGSAYNYGVQEPYVAASISKLLTATYYLQTIEENDESLDDQIGALSGKEQLRMLIEKSDQTAWVAINDEIGRPNLEKYAIKHGFAEYSVESNHVRPSQIAAFLKELYSGKLLNKNNTARLLGHMKNASEPQYVADVAKPYATVYHKTGYLKDRVHDAAIIDNGTYPFALVIFTKAKGDYDFLEGKKLLNTITEDVLVAFDIKQASAQ